MGTETKIQAVLILPSPPNTDDKEDLLRYIRELHKVLDEWHIISRADTSYATAQAHEHSNKEVLDTITGKTWNDFK